ncbi:MAG: hypothetical protein AVDCRST_MAG05-5243 [uncultured Rubrobacteraceae bacterium]|uniref:Uncharacterized protein n=1 Tax=uncultured Rubrobacteraceae bacterium TaxID=349277 RepID=A0A6J4U656_9ACTN|nr:MAG: hypothetical protein AVDCRST_MAG05-5243 [uncultured Rubrobacteraceae bacterium]
MTLRTKRQQPYARWDGHSSGEARKLSPTNAWELALGA